MPDTGATVPNEINATLFFAADEPEFVAGAMSHATGGEPVLAITGSDAFARLFGAGHSMDFAEAQLDSVPLNIDDVLDRLRQRLAAVPDVACVVIDMSWTHAPATSVGGIEGWGDIAERLCARPGVAVVSAFDKEFLVEDQLQAAMRATQQFISPSGLRENPHWLPNEIRLGSTLDEKLGFMLGRIVPEFAGSGGLRRIDQMAARGGAPDWLDRAPLVPAETSDRPPWYIRCLGPLEVFAGGPEPVDWRQPGSAPKKTRTLFAYLLNAGEKGAHADQICELLWQGEEPNAKKRARLHHTVAMLRRTLGGQDAVLRIDESYRLNVPPGSRIDVDSFEQICRRGLSFARAGKNEAALKLYLEGERQYRGDLFENLPHEYLSTETEDWIIPRRTWLRDMAVRLHYDMSKLLRRYSRLGEALDHALKAVALDPLNEAANTEAMRVFHAQGRIEAMHRQFRQYSAALNAIGVSAPGPEVTSVYGEMCRSLDHLSPTRRKMRDLSLR
ncbi:hypothetical protein JQU17_03315 [Ponticoccus sp. SC2-23]|uniref:AfsR/SARP family transcriptional regulator n=1 Tax=Alexandriicola marinus TaxID=2081710 RepID=UPI0013DF90F0|nr:BTAD domain-containing putative transcriptional regulator [Alexandriicola marinus]MBM1219215.1 hypothetical protein [Ponticoccus sp. SC6-9]MBM1223713.1 hypothetical protein [Ponticoccus sp. SC6-15]MBM1229028.1 hypothetical protein [Ponticoccus sp. SC6-38]MBM1232679.1 hypothetical protein [Ponticoccus sp. SC6-45]MBM1237371.1 hypothetical protein [Ponticoccus sp. SC6-49]MBM1241690.1 hypothetical protein [Ponticoccus sp. SC2-64]MBM1246203.1 hypothetical protein [Ponticoccus sp. SC6-42]MBM12